ncbi:MAG: glycosyltransferase [Cyanobacterium sp.]
MRIIALPAFRSCYKNPYNCLLYSPMKKKGVNIDDFSVSKAIINSYDILHLHWPLEKVFENSNSLTSVIRMMVLLTIIDWMRLRKTKIIWTVHNLKHHENPYPKIATWFWGAFIPRLDGYINLSKTGQKSAQKHFPLLRNIPSYTIYHGHYRNTYPNDITQLQARKKLNLSNDSPVIAFFGLIRPYKNVPHLISIFRKLTNSHITLLVAGKPSDEQLKREILAVKEEDKRIKLELKFISNQEVQIYLNAADLVVLPFTEVLNSGSALLALSYNRPILVPAKGAMGELKSKIGESWVKTYSGDLTVEVLQEGLSWCFSHERSSVAPLNKLSWEVLSNQTLEMYKTLCEK